MAITITVTITVKDFEYDYGSAYGTSRGYIWNHVPLLLMCFTFTFTFTPKAPPAGPELSPSSVFAPPSPVQSFGSKDERPGRRGHPKSLNWGGGCGFKRTRARSATIVLTLVFHGGSD